MRPSPTPRRLRVVTAGVAGLAIMACGASVAAQSASAKVASIEDGQVRFTYVLRPGVCGYGQNIWRNGIKGSMVRMGDSKSRDVEYDVECDSGPGRVVIDKRDGLVEDVRNYVGGRWRSNATATDLGELSGKEAMDLLLNIVRRTPGKASERAIFPLTLIDDITIAPELLRIARDDSRPTSTRKSAVFWLSQLAEEPATAGLKEIVGEAAVDRDVREQAVFALSQRPKDEGIPALINVVKSNRDPELRKKALFWLGQSGDPRALNLIEELLTKR